MKKLFILIGAALLLFAFPAFADVYSIDPDHSEIGFSVRHMVITNVNGAFREYKADLTVDDNNRLTAFQAEVKVASIDTRIQKRDDHLRSPDFFDVVKYPAITFKSGSVSPGAGNTFTVTGELKIRDVVKQVELDGELTGPVKDPWGNQRMGIVLRGRIDRNDFGVSYNKVLETGGLLIDNEVNVHLEGQGILTK